MQSIKLKREDLLAKLTANRDAHKLEFAEAMANYKTKFAEILTTKLKDLEEGKDVDQRINLTLPVNYKKQYDTAIAMVESTIDEVIDLDQHTFTQYYLDEWAWTSQYLMSNRAYSGSVESKYRAMSE